MLIIESPTVTMKCRTAIKALFLYFNLCLSVMLDSRPFWRSRHALSLVSRESPIGRAVILVIMSVDTFKTDAIVFIGDVIIYLTSDWLIFFSMRVPNWPNIFVDQGQFSDPDLISGTHQRENVQFATKHTCIAVSSNFLWSE